MLDGIVLPTFVDFPLGTLKKKTLDTPLNQNMFETINRWITGVDISYIPTISSTLDEEIPSAYIQYHCRWLKPIFR